jgi:hypothetical protein
MELIDKYLPKYNFRERHARNVLADPEVTIEAALAYRPESDPFFRTAIAIRELPMRMLAALGGRRETAAPPFSLSNFTLLESRPGRELAYGLVGRFWQFGYGLVPIADGPAFRAFEASGVAKLVLGFSAAPQASGHARLTTETRVFCPDRATYRSFAPYWYLIRPVSGMIRGRTLKSIQRASESSQTASMSQGELR